MVWAGRNCMMVELRELMSHILMQSVDEPQMDTGGQQPKSSLISIYLSMASKTQTWNVQDARGS